MRRSKESKNKSKTQVIVLFSILNLCPGDSLNFILYELTFLETRHGNTE